MTEFRVDTAGAAPGAPPAMEGERIGRTGAPTVVFLHGWLMSPAIWREVVRAAPGDLDAVCVRQPGHGPTSGPGAGFDLAGWADWVLAGLDRLNVERAVFVGHSMGGLVALEILARAPHRTAGLCLVGSSAEPWSPEAAEGLRTSARHVADAWSEPLAGLLAPFLISPARAADTDWLGGWTQETAGYDLASAPRLIEAVVGRRDHLEVLSRARVPCAVVHGAADLGVPVEAARRAAAAAGVEPTILADVGHCPPLEAPEAVARAVHRVVNGVRA